MDMNKLLKLNALDAFAAKADAKIKAVEVKADAALNGNFSTDTAIYSSGLRLAIGDNQPANKSMWLDTSDYASVNGAIPTYLPIANGGDLKFEVSDTAPIKTNIWINSSNYGGEK